MLVIILSALVGLSLGLLGGGGSILTTPILLYAGHLEGKEAIASSLVVVGTTAAVSALQHARAGQIRVRPGLTLGAAAMLGAFAGGRIAGLVPASFLLGGFTLMMVFAGLMMLRPRPVAAAASPRPLWLASAGVAIGFVTGLVGAGGGFIVVPALVLIGGLSMRAAIGTSLLVIALQSAAGLAGHLGHVQIDWSQTTLVSASAIGGSLVGTLLARRTSPDALRRNFALFVLAMAFYIGFKLLPSPIDGAASTAALIVASAVSLVAGIQLGRHPLRPRPLANAPTAA